MSTSDGIGTADWDRVHELAVEIANADAAGSQACRARLLGYLDELELKYGELPSILATRADYINVPTQREPLLSRAHALAESRGDARNLLYVAHSLAELHIEQRKDLIEGRRWLERIREHLVQVDDAYFAEELERLSDAAD